MIGRDGLPRRRFAEIQPCLERVVGTAPQRDVVRCCIAADRVRLHVVELQKGRLPAPPPRADERATSAVALPDLSPDRRRDVTRPRRRGRRHAWPDIVAPLDMLRCGFPVEDEDTGLWSAPVGQPTGEPAPTRMHGRDLLSPREVDQLGQWRLVVDMPVTMSSEPQKRSTLLRPKAGRSYRRAR